MSPTAGKSYIIVIERTGLDAGNLLLVDIDPEKICLYNIIKDCCDEWGLSENDFLLVCSNGMVLENDVDLFVMFELYKDDEEIKLVMQENIGPPLDVKGPNEPIPGNESRPLLITYDKVIKSQSHGEAGNVRDNVRGNDGEENDEDNIYDEESDSLVDDCPYPSDEEPVSYTDNEDEELVNDIDHTFGEEDGSEMDGVEEGIGVEEAVAGVGLENEAVDSAKEADLRGNRTNEATTNFGVEDDGWETGGETDVEQPAESSDSEGCCGGVKIRKQVDPISDRGKIYNETAKNFKFQRGQLFKDIKVLRGALLDYEVLGGYKLRRVKNYLIRLQVDCIGASYEGEKCNWLLHATRLPDGKTFRLKKLIAEHTCVRGGGRRPLIANCVWIAKKLKHHLRVDPNMSYELMEDIMKREWGVSLPQHTLYRARLKANKKNEGEHYGSIKQLHRYAEQLRCTNPGSVMNFEYEETSDPSGPSGVRIFKRVFVCIEAVRQGFLTGYRPFIGLDGCHLKGPYGGVLLAAVALDGNKGLYPLAFAIVEIECKSSWLFFLNQLKLCIGENWKGKKYTFMMDRQKGVVSGVEECFPTAGIRYCARHLYANFRNDVRAATSLRDEFWMAIKASTEMEFNRAIESLIQQGRMDAYNWLIREPVNRWARYAYSMEARCEHVTNNLTESFNSWLGKVRGMPIVRMIDAIRQKMMLRLSKRYQAGLSWKSIVTDNIKKKLNDIEVQGKNCSLIQASVDEYEVAFEDHRYAVNLRQRTCTCNWWQLSGLPCKHATQCIVNLGRCVEHYCDTFFMKKLYMDTYRFVIHPMDCADLNPRTDEESLLPPPLKRLPGRPRKNRRRQQSEPNQHGSGRKGGGTIKCNNCGLFGHNKRTCQRAPIAGSSNVTSGSGVGGVRGRGKGRGKGKGKGRTGGIGLDNNCGGVSIGRGRGSGGVGMGRGCRINMGMGKLSRIGRGIGLGQGNIGTCDPQQGISSALGSQPQSSKRRKLTPIRNTQ